MKKCLIVGGGLAGLSAGVFLSKNNIKVTILESSPKLGGRAYSFLDRNTNTILDNGQHILMGCYESALKLLDIIGSMNKVNLPDSLNVTYLKRGGAQYSLESVGKIYPLNLIGGLLKFDLLKFTERINLFKLFTKLIFVRPEDYSDISALLWLVQTNQNDKVINQFWNHFIISTLNASPEDVSAEVLIRILKIVFMKNNRSATIITPKVGLSQLFCEDALKFIERKNGKILFKERVEHFEFNQNRISRIRSNNRIFKDFDYVITAIPSGSLKKISGINFSIMELKYSPILSVNLWLRKNEFEKEFYGLVNSKIDWVFNHQAYISIVKSNAKELLSLRRQKIVELITRELQNYFPNFNNSNVIGSKVIKERYATFIPTIETELWRKQISSPAENLIFAGDWTNTGLPSTIEGAIRSGELAAKKIIKTT